MDKIKLENIFAAVSEKSILDPLLAVLDPKEVKFWGTEGTIRYLKSKGFWAKSVVSGFDFDGRVKTLDRTIFIRILADRSKKRHILELSKLASQGEALRGWRAGMGPFDLIIVDLYNLDNNNFPESMDIGGQALIRAAIKNYQNVAVAFDSKSIHDLVSEFRKNGGSITLKFRKAQAKKAANFIAQRTKLESRILKHE
ncbi:hypothetical protein HYS90_00200 [Candidatus Curtissbacteria bacterium]|nr:hypothetical protein [Candidatus Curtissbacteria bacterium]